MPGRSVTQLGEGWINLAHDLNGELIVRCRPRAALAGPAAQHERAEFYARCSVFENLAYGIEHERAHYVESSLASMEWLFPPR
jgi:hypothetical protein